MADIQQATDVVLRQEDSRMSGVITTIPGDSGGRTRFGIAERWHPELTATGFFTTMPTAEALKVAEGVYAALAKPQVLTNCNAAIFVNSQDVLVVDAHSKPSAAAALIAQIKKDITTKPVRYLVNSHFHWDHTQGNAAYKARRGESGQHSTTEQVSTVSLNARKPGCLALIPGRC